MMRRRWGRPAVERLTMSAARRVGRSRCRPTRRLRRGQCPLIVDDRGGVLATGDVISHEVPGVAHPGATVTTNRLGKGTAGTQGERSAGMTRRQAVITRQAARGEGAARRPGVAPLGEGGAEHRRDAGEEVGHADEVAQDEVPVKADKGQQLLEHLQVGDGDGQQHDLIGGERVAAEQPEHEDHVEVHAAEVGAETARPAEPVGVGDVGEERRPDQVDVAPVCRNLTPP